MVEAEVGPEYTCRDLVELHSLSTQLPQGHLFFTSPLLTSFLTANISRTIIYNYEQYDDLPWTMVSTSRADPKDLAC